MTNSQFTLDLKPMGLHLRVVSNSSAIIAAVEASFGGFGPADPASEVQLALHLFTHQVKMAAGPLPEPLLRQHGPLLYQTIGREGTMVVDQTRCEAFGYFSPPIIEQTAFFRWHFVDLAVLAMLKTHGLMGVHGAAVARRGRAILLRAQSGGGKTTLAYACTQHNFRALAEDVVWLQNDGQCWWGMPWHFHLLPDARQLFPELSQFSPVLQTNAEMKLEVPLESVRPQSTVFSARPGPVVLVQRAEGQESRLETLDLAQAWPLWTQGAAGNELEFPAYRQHISQLLQNNVYLLHFGDDIPAAVGLLENLV